MKESFREIPKLSFKEDGYSFKEQTFREGEVEESYHHGVEEMRILSILYL